MPFQSKAQSRLFFAKATRGELPMNTAKEWANETEYRALPERKAVYQPKASMRKYYGSKE